MRHTIVLEFTTETPLTEKEMDNLISMLSLQLEEPQDLEGNPEEWKSTFISFAKTDRKTGGFVSR